MDIALAVPTYNQVGLLRIFLKAWRDRGADLVPLIIVDDGSNDATAEVLRNATHPRLTWLGDDDVARELARSRAAIRDALDVDPAALSWPFGAHGQREHRIAEREGYTLGLTIGGARAWTDDLFAVPRHPVYVWSPPAPGFGVLATLDAVAGTVANRCAVGTSIINRAFG